MVVARISLIAESIGNRLRHIASCQIVDNDLRTSFVAELVSQDLNGFLCVSVNGGIGDHNALFLNGIGGPDIIFFNIVAQVFFQNGTMERADGLDVQSSGNLQKLLHLHAVFSDDTDEIAACFIIPGFVSIQSTEFSETVSCKENLVGAVVSP